MNTRRTIAVVVGSLRKGSYSKAIAHALAQAAPENLQLRIVEIGELGLYNQDLDSTPLANWTVFRDEIRSADAVLFVTPEYNRSMPGVLKNVGSRPYGHSAWDGKPGAVVSVSPGALAAFGANHHLRQSLVFLNVPVMQQPEAYIGGAADLLNVEGKVKNESTRAFLSKFMAAFADWIEKCAPRR